MVTNKQTDFKNVYLDNSLMNDGENGLGFSSVCEIDDNHTETGYSVQGMGPNFTLRKLL